MCISNHETHLTQSIFLRSQGITAHRKVGVVLIHIPLILVVLVFGCNELDPEGYNYRYIFLSSNNPYSYEK